MLEAELTLVLSGHLRRPDSADLRPFWRGFIELQKKLPKGKKVSQIAAHSWNPELASLVKLVYDPNLEFHEQQASFYHEFIWQIEPPERFEKGLDRLSSTWKNVSIQTVLGNARSRARAVKLMTNLPSANGQVLVTRWDLGQTGSAQVNQLVADEALPDDFIYLSYFSEVDEGYADMWFLAPWVLAKRFAQFDSFVIDCLTGRNRYLLQFSAEGWPRARVKSLLELWKSHPVGQRVLRIAKKMLKGSQDVLLKDTLHQRITRRLIGPVQRYIDQPHLTAENSCVDADKSKPVVFHTFMALNIHALLKYFILKEEMRSRVRFLTSEDFDISAKLGQLINPQPIVLFLQELDEMAIDKCFIRSPLPLEAIYLIGKGEVCQVVSDGEGRWQSNRLKPVGDTTRDLMICAFQAEKARTNKVMPILVMPSLTCFLGCTDWFYMNALAKYLTWGNLKYIGLSCLNKGKPYLEFPDLQIVRGGGAFSLRLAAGTVDGISSFLEAADPELIEISERADKMLLEFPVVAKFPNLF